MITIGDLQGLFFVLADHSYFTVIFFDVYHNELTVAESPSFKVGGELL